MKRTMNPIIITSIMALFTTLGFGAVAQGPSDPDGRQHRRAAHMERMKAELDLTDVQVEQIRALKETHMASCGKRSRSGKGSADREQCAAARKEFRQAVRDVLTPEQRTIMDARKQERRKHKKSRRNTPRCDCPARNTAQ